MKKTLLLLSVCTFPVVYGATPSLSASQKKELEKTSNGSHIRTGLQFLDDKDQQLVTEVLGSQTRKANAKFGAAQLKASHRAESLEAIEKNPALTETERLKEKFKLAKQNAVSKGHKQRK